MADKKKKPVKVKVKADPGVTDSARMARSIFERVREIKAAHPALAKRVDRCEEEIRDMLEKIATDIQVLDTRDRELVAIMVINGLYNEAEAILTEE